MVSRVYWRVGADKKKQQKSGYKGNGVVPNEKRRPSRSFNEKNFLASVFFYTGAIQELKSHIRVIYIFVKMYTL